MEKNMDGALLQGGKYQIKRFISSGGFGCTYEGVHNQLKIRVAIKEFFVREYCHRDDAGRITLNTEQHRPAIERLKGKFLDEARALAGMYHEGIVHVYDVFEENGSAYYVMDYIDGETLYDTVQARGALSQLEAVTVVAKAARALEYVHNLNRLHLDIKPANIMRDKNGKVYVIDFGVSKQYDKDSKSNMSTLMGMSMGYSAIEQMSNNVKLFAPATDIYSLGATLYYLLTGTDPASATDMASGEQLAPLPSHIHPQVAETVYRAMSLNRADRQQSIAEFLDMLPPAPELDAPAPVAEKPAGPHTVHINPAAQQQPVSQQPISKQPITNQGTMPMQPQPQQPLSPQYPGYEKPKKRKTWLVALLSALGTVVVIIVVLALIGADDKKPAKKTSSEGHTTITASDYDKSSSSSSSSTSSASSSTSNTTASTTKTVPTKDEDGETTASTSKSDIDVKLDKAERIADKMVAGKASVNEMLELADIMSAIGTKASSLNKSQRDRLDKLSKKMDKIK